MASEADGCTGMRQIFEELLDGRPVSTGDLIGTVDGGASLNGMLFKVIGELIPGKPDHIAIYLGPHGICAEAAPKGVHLFRFFKGRWDSDRMEGQRGIVDKLYGIRSCLREGLSSQKGENAARAVVRDYVLAQMGKPYNLNFAATDQEKAFYCSQLAWAAYRQAGVDLWPKPGAKRHPLLPKGVITPEDVWRACGEGVR